MSSSTTFSSQNQSFESGRTDRFFHDEESEISKWLKLENDLPVPSSSSMNNTGSSSTTALPTFSQVSSAPFNPNLDFSSNSSFPFPSGQFPNSQFPFNPYGTYPQQGFPFQPYPGSTVPTTFFPSSHPFANVNLGALALLPGLFGSQPGLAQMTPAQLYHLLAQFQHVVKNSGLLVGDLTNGLNFDPNAPIPSVTPSSNSNGNPSVNGPSNGSESSPSASSSASSSASEKKRKHVAAAPSSPTMGSPLSSPSVSRTNSASSVTGGNNASANAPNSGVPRRVRQTRPKVVEAKGAVQCKGRNRKKGIQCRNAALMEYIGPRPIYCAEHIELDPKSLYEKCKSQYQKEVGDNKGCKEVVLKEFGYCYKHYHDLVGEMIRNNDSEGAYRHSIRIGELLIQLEKEASAAKKKDGDLYQRKNKLIPKFQEMKKLISKTMVDHFNGQVFDGVVLSAPSASSPSVSGSVSSSAVNSPTQSPVLPVVTAFVDDGEDIHSSPSSTASFSNTDDELSCGGNDHLQDASDELPEEISPQIHHHHHHHELHHSASSFDDDLGSDLSSGSDFGQCCPDFHHDHAGVNAHEIRSALSDSGSSSSDQDGDNHLVLCSSSEVDLVTDAVDFVDAVNSHSVASLMGSF